MKYQARVLNISDQTERRKNYILDVDLINFLPKNDIHTWWYGEMLYISTAQLNPILDDEKSSTCELADIGSYFLIKTRQHWDLKVSNFCNKTSKETNRCQTCNALGAIMPELIALKNMYTNILRITAFSW